MKDPLFTFDGLCYVLRAISGSVAWYVEYAQLNRKVNAIITLVERM